MPEAKQIPVKKQIKYFSDNEDTIIMNNNSNTSEESSVDFFNKSTDYIPVLVINKNSINEPDTIAFNNQNYLSKSEYNHPEKESLTIDKMQSLLNGLLTKDQTGYILKLATRKKTRLLVKRGGTHIALNLPDIALIYTKDKLVYVIDHASKKYSIDKTLTQLEEELDTNIFFRANRQYIISINFIKSFKIYQKVKLLVEMNVAELEEPVVISQLVAPVFKKWMNDA
jgi:hypothetical protein